MVEELSWGALRDVARLASALDEEQPDLRPALKGLQEFLGGEYTFAVLSGDDPTRPALCLSTFPEGFPAAEYSLHLTILAYGGPIAERPEGVMRWVEDLHTEASFASTLPFADRLGFRACVLTPIRAGSQQVSGVVGVCFARPTAYDEAAAGALDILVSLLATSWANFRLRQQLTRAQRAAEDALLQDELTGVATRRQVFQALEQELAAAQRYGHALSCLMTDVDGLKSVNDRHGHQVGDRVLKALAHELQGAVRLADTLGRYGGDEFLVVLPQTDAEGAAQLAERLLRAARQSDIATSEGPIRLTLSVGSATYQGEGALEMDALLRAADLAMYEAKQAGGDRHCAAPGAPTSMWDPVAARRAAPGPEAQPQPAGE